MFVTLENMDRWTVILWQAIQSSNVDGFVIVLICLSEKFCLAWPCLGFHLSLPVPGLDLPLPFLTENHIKLFREHQHI
jgi:hypothetical protein